MHLQESGEMYLETILILSEKTGFVRSVDVCEYMGFSKPSVSRAIGILKNAGYVNVAKDGGLTLTESGAEIAKKIYERHSVLTELLKELGVSDGTAASDACKMEHVISDETFEKIKEHASKYNKK
ncbi:MAG: metal-dependent transcriptional regulator [Eubacteriales bacterium]